MSITKTADLKARSRIDPYDPNPYDPCWHYLGSLVAGRPRIWAFDYDHGEKRCMVGPRAVWSISRGKSPGERLVYRTCWGADCVNPGHHALALDKADLGRILAKSGRLKGTHLVVRQANASKARAARGIVDTPAEIVYAIRAAERSRTNSALAIEHGIAHQTVSYIRSGQRRASV